MIGIVFRGWFQCRLASDPDPSDDARGISGCTFATVGEPDLDRIIRFSPEGCVPRSFGPEIGVRVTGVRGTGEAAAKASAALTGAQVDLPGGAMFVEENGALVPRNTAILDPFDLRLVDAGGATLLRRKALWDPARPELSAYDVPAGALTARQPKMLQMNAAAKVAAASGTGDSDVYLDRRLRRLRAAQADAEQDGDAVATAALQQRIASLELTDWRAMRSAMLLKARAWWRFHLNEQAATTEVSGALPRLDAAVPWRLAVWFGAWDNDALCGYVMGRLVADLADGAP